MQIIFVHTHMCNVCKHFPASAALVVALITLFVEPVIRILYAAVSWSPMLMSETIRAYLRLWRAIPQMIQTIKNM